MYYHSNPIFMSCWDAIPTLLNRDDCIGLLNVIDNERQSCTLSEREMTILEASVRIFASTRGIDCP